MKRVAVLIVSLLVYGCMFIGLNEDVNQLKKAVSIVGKIELTNGGASPIVVTLSRSGDGNYPMQAYTVVYGASEFFFSVPKGKYYLFAFEDTNHDFTLQESERVGWHGFPSLITAESGETYSNMHIRLRKPEKAKKELPALFVPGNEHNPVNFNRAKIGEVVETSIFKQELGPLGMWEPVKFHLQGYSGIYFLEPYDDNKIPVLFVHGISGSGHDWLYLIEKLDREYFQPWVVQYPSGMRLDLLSQSLSQSVNELKAIYKFEDLAVIAHSMGGLVSRGFINDQLSSNRKNTVIKTFVSISTPWLGHNAASQGSRAPVAVPAWFDMVPGSPYLQSLHERPLPGDIEYYLLFGHQGKGLGIFGGTNSDGTVTLRSQLSQKAQSEAIKVVGYDENHTGILTSKEVSNKINQILAETLLN